MNTATQVGLTIFAGLAFCCLLAGWFAVCWIMQGSLEAKYKRRLPFSGLALYLAPVVGIGLICLGYGLIIQPETTEQQEETVTKEELQATLDKHLQDLVQHYANVDHKQVYHPDNNQPGVYITHLEFVDLNGLVTTLRLMEEE